MILLPGTWPVSALPQGITGEGAKSGSKMIHHNGEIHLDYMIAILGGTSRFRINTTYLGHPAHRVLQHHSKREGSYYSFPFGSNSDIAVPGDYDRDEKFDPAVFRGPGGTWHVSRSSGGTLIQQFGQNGDSPVPNSFVW
jgi:hypothetical protein